MLIEEIWKKQIFTSIWLLCHTTLFFYFGILPLLTVRKLHSRQETIGNYPPAAYKDIEQNSVVTNKHKNTILQIKHQSFILQVLHFCLHWARADNYLTASPATSYFPH